MNTTGKTLLGLLGTVVAWELRDWHLVAGIFAACATGAFMALQALKLARELRRK